MPVIRYRDVSQLPPAILGEAEMTPTEGLRMACDLSSAALRLAGSTAPTERVRKLQATEASSGPARTPGADGE